MWVHLRIWVDVSFQTLSATDFLILSAVSYSCYKLCRFPSWNSSLLDFFFLLNRNLTYPEDFLLQKSPVSILTLRNVFYGNWQIYIFAYHIYIYTVSFCIGMFKNFLPLSVALAFYFVKMEGVKEKEGERHFRRMIHSATACHVKGWGKNWEPGVQFRSSKWSSIILFLSTFFFLPLFITSQSLY